MTFIGISTLIVASVLYNNVDLTLSSFDHPQIFGTLESSFRHAFFQVVAVITTTGFVTADFTAWTPFLTIVFFGLMFMGGSAGSTSGGVKGVRHMLMIKSGFLEFKRALHPNAIIQPRHNGSILKEEVVYNIYAFFILYLLSLSLIHISEPTRRTPISYQHTRKKTVTFFNDTATTEIYT